MNVRILLAIKQTLKPKLDEIYDPEGTCSMDPRTFRKFNPLIFKLRLPWLATDTAEVMREENGIREE